MLANYRCFESI